MSYKVTTGKNIKVAQINNIENNGAFMAYSHWLAIAKQLIVYIIYLAALCFVSFDLRAQCAISYSAGCSSGIDIQDFHFNGELGTGLHNFFSGCSPSSYMNYSPMSVTLNRGGSYTVNINSEAAGGNVQMFIDYDDDGNFSPAESVGGANDIAVFPSMSNFVVHIPLSASVGAHRIRVVVSGTTTYPSIIGCGALSVGETHDYMVVISATITPCAAPVVLVAGAIGYTTAHIGWTAPLGAIRFQYVVDNTLSDPVGSGISIGTDSFNVSGLLPGTLYYAHVRDSCISGLLSPWSTVSFTTVSSAPPCGAVAGLAVSGLSSTSATVNWPPVVGSSGYQYVVDNTPVAPYIYGTGITTFATSVTATALIPETTYYIHVRDSCAPTNMSVWVTTSFTTTAPCPFVTSLAASSITSNTAHISWSGAVESIGYKYVLDNSPADPSTPGNYISANFVDFTSLTPATLYYVHVRDTCSAGLVSPWKTILFNTLTASSVSFNEGSEYSFKIYPVPFNDHLNVQATDCGITPASVDIFDINGRHIKSAIYKGGIETIDLSGTAPGTYICRYTDARHTYTTRIIKK